MSHYEEFAENMVEQAIEQREKQLKAWEEYSKVNKDHTTDGRKTILSELLEIFKDTRDDANITFRGFLLGNYSLEALKNDFPNLYRYISNVGER